MSGSVATLVPLVAAVVTVALWVVVLLRLAHRAARLPLALTAFASAWSTCFVLLKTQAPHWTILPGAALVLGGIVVVVVAGQTSLPHDAGDDGSDDGGTGGGGPGRRPPDRPTGGGDPAEPSWWPQFERDLARYVAQREHDERRALINRDQVEIAAR